MTKLLNSLTLYFMSFFSILSFLNIRLSTLPECQKPRELKKTRLLVIGLENSYLHLVFKLLLFRTILYTSFPTVYYCSGLRQNMGATSSNSSPSSIFA